MAILNLRKTVFMAIEATTIITMAMIVGFGCYFVYRVDLDASDKEIIALYAGLFVVSIHSILLYHIVKHFISYHIKKEIKRFNALKVWLTLYILLGFLIWLKVFVLESNFARYCSGVFLIVTTSYLASLFLNNERGK